MPLFFRCGNLDSERLMWFAQRHKTRKHYSSDSTVNPSDCRATPFLHASLFWNWKTSLFFFFSFPFQAVALKSEKKPLWERLSRSQSSFIRISICHIPILDCPLFLALLHFAASVFKACHANRTTEELGNGDSKVVHCKLGRGDGTEPPFSQAGVMK